VKNSTRTQKAFEAVPQAALECFIAEQNMIGVAVGLQARGRRVFAATFAAFLTRAFDQIRMAAYSRADLKLAGSHVGVGIGRDGPSQMGLEDVAMMRTVPGSLVLSPADAVAAQRLTGVCAEYRGISYLRLARQKTPVLYDNSEQFPPGGSKVLRVSPADRAAIVATGPTVAEALAAADELAGEGTAVRVVDCYSLKPLDGATLRTAARETGRIVTVEDHVSEGGLGEAVASAVAGLAPVEILAVKKMPHSGSGAELYGEQGIDAEAIRRHLAG
jgi:transketolase